MSQDSNHTFLRGVLQSHKILADTSFLMHPSFGKFLDDFSVEFRSNRILVPRKVVQELQRMEKKKDHRLQAAQHALQLIEQAVSNGLAEIRGESSDDSARVADHVISRVVEQHMAQYNIVVLTNDRRLRDWIYAKKRSGCFSTDKSLLVVRFEPRDGKPHIWGREMQLPISDHGQTVFPAVPPQPFRARSKPVWNLPQPFACTNRLESGLETRLLATEDVEKVSFVYSYNGQRLRQVRLCRKLASGGEGTIYETDQPDILCKIYHTNRLTDGARRKVELMVTRQVAHPGICWPIESVRDSQGVFRGFLMPRASGEPLGHGLFIPTVWLSKHPNWTRRESVRLAISILEGIEYLHRMNVLLGDINPMNILVKDANTVFFVDCDSYQVEGFPCPVGSINFTAPEIQGQDFSRFLRTKEHELFAVATLLFMIMVPGKPPYSHQGGGDGAENIKKMHFPYPLGEKGAQDAPEGAWRFCWSHLSRPIKEYFYQVFHKDCQGQPRVTVAEWLRVFREYERILQDPNKVFMGPTPQYGFDLQILPHNFRYVEGRGRPLPTGGETDLQRSVNRMVNAATSVTRGVSTSGQSASAWFQSNRTPPQYTPGSLTSSQGGYQAPSYLNTPASTHASSSYSGKGEWYLNPLIWPVAAIIKAVLEVMLAGLGLAILGLGVGLLLVLLGIVEDVGPWVKGGGFIGICIGVFGAIASVTEVDGNIFKYGGGGGLVVGVGMAVLTDSMNWFILGFLMGVVLGLFLWRVDAGEHSAAAYMRKWWGTE
jgi:rRNA-processing protein FCF1/serine/threonine protein kinase